MSNHTETTEEHEDSYPLVYNMWITINVSEGANVTVNNNQTGNPDDNPPPSGGD